ncbi:MAG: IPT/TIG domain-containing protein, partial [Bacteroidota bacterium]
MKRTYRNLSYVSAFMTLVLLSLFGCGDDDNDAPAPNAPDAAPLTIQALLPDSGQVADLIKIVGSGFGQEKTKVQVAFNSKTASIESVSDTLIQVKVPEGATSGKVRVIVAEDTVLSSQDFRVVSEVEVPTLSIAKLSASSGKVGD